MNFTVWLFDHWEANSNTFLSVELDLYVLFDVYFFFFRKDFIVYQAIDAEPTKVTDNNFKDKVTIY